MNADKCASVRAKDEGHAMPDLALVAADVHQFAALQRQRRRGGLVGAEEPALHQRQRQIVRPPSTGNSTPVMKHAASLAR